MKKLMLVFALLAGLSAFAQNSHGVEFAFTRTDLNKNLVLNVHRTMGRHDLYVGALFHIYQVPNASHFYRQNGYAANLPQHFGFDCGYQLQVAKHSAFKAYSFYSLQVMHMGVRVPNIPEWFATGSTYTSAPFLSLSHSLGMGINTTLPKGFQLTHQIGIGYCMINEPGFSSITPSWTGEFIAPFYRVGLRFDLPNRKAAGTPSY